MTLGSADPVPAADPRRGEVDPVGAGAEPPDYEVLFQQAPCGYLTAGEDGRISDVNETFLHWTGHRRGDLVGTRLVKLFPIGDQVLFSTHCVPLLAMVGAVAEVAVEVIGADRVRRAALLSATRSVHSPGASPQTRIIVFSAHERRRYEKELLASRRIAADSEAQRAAAEADLQHLVLHDSLTGLLNRAGLFHRMDAALSLTEPVRASGSAPAHDPDGHAAIARGGPVLVLLFVDLDHFKAVNDGLGHAAGDELLRLTASRLEAEVRNSATVARLSGDEFVIVDHVADADQVPALAQRLLDAVTRPVLLDGLELVVSASIGATVSTRVTDTAEQMLRRADVAMYRAKARGRSCWELHDPADVDPTADRLRLLGELRHGIDHGQLRVHYQPRMDLRTDRIHGVEALVRWAHPTRGLLAPHEFIALAEDSGLILPLGAWVLEEAVAQAARWCHVPLDGSPIGVAVNLSTRQLSDPHLVDEVSAILDRHQLPPHLLTLEITETAIMADPTAAGATLSALRALGAHLAIDDFGTGYASLTYLLRFPIDELKIDQSFVAELGSNTATSAIVASCVQLAHAVGIHALAEGVETDQQRTLLVDLACDYAQGYHYSRPLPAAALTAWIIDRASTAADRDSADLPVS